jgi:hypothetical protein
MSPDASLKDLILLVADKDIEYALRGILSKRQRAIGIREITYDVHVHGDRDPGCRIKGSDFLRPFAGQYSHALLIFDLAGSGQDALTRDMLESQLENELHHSPWGERAAVIAIEPELEVWVWSDSPQVDRCLGWADRSSNLRDWLVQKSFLDVGQSKPLRPKEALEATLRQVGKPRSSDIYRSIAEKVSLRRCSDPAFLKLKSTLIRWFMRTNP